MSKSPFILEIQGAAKRFGNGRGIEEVSLSLRRGEIYGLFGPNGAGKSTLMKIIAGQMKTDRGTVRLFGHDPYTDIEQALAHVGLLIEAPVSFPYMTARQHLRQAARYYAQVTEARIQEVLELVGLQACMNEKMAGYSLGMKQRLGIALALLSHPQLLVLDEPTNGLDLEGMVEIRQLLQRLSHSQGISVLLSSHMLGEMEQICTRVGILHQGRLVREGSAGELYDRTGNHAPSLEQVFLDTLEQHRRGKTDEQLSS
jgi:ABC-2 type transport system ATP-binding protein